MGATSPPPLPAASGHADAALVLGAKVGDDGEPSPFLRERVELGARLYRDGIVDAGRHVGAAHRTSGGYDEPATMRDLAVSLRGATVDAIILDREGVDTFASCANTAALELGDVIVVTQEFHVARAVWLCQRAGWRRHGCLSPDPGPSRDRHGQRPRTRRRLQGRHQRVERALRRPRVTSRDLGPSSLLSDANPPRRRPRTRGDDCRPHPGVTHVMSQIV